MENEVIALRVPKTMKKWIDAIVKDGLYMNQSDLIRTAIRNLLKTHGYQDVYVEK